MVGPIPPLNSFRGVKGLGRFFDKRKLRIAPHPRHSEYSYLIRKIKTLPHRYMITGLFPLLDKEYFVCCLEVI
jgi:hypothetical protein